MVNAIDFSDFDRFTFWVIVALSSLGWVMVYSASVAFGPASDNHMYYFFRHSLFILISVACALIVVNIPMQAIRRVAPWLFVVGALLLVLVLIPGFGRHVKGAYRWLNTPVFSVQPAEIMKLLSILYAADYTVRKMAYMKSIRHGFLPMAIVMMAIGTLLISQPDFGSLVVIVAVSLAILFMGGMRLILFVILAIVLLAAFSALAWFEPYRRDRLLSFLSPFDDAFGSGYQLSQALIAFGRGEFTGVGLGASVEKLRYLPEAHTDFVLAVAGEELGFIGVTIIISLYAILVFRAFQIANHAADLERLYGALVAYGIAICIGLQTIINLGVNLGVLPTKGLTLPFMSYGGSSLFITFISMAILFRIDFENRRTRSQRRRS